MRGGGVGGLFPLCWAWVGSSSQLARKLLPRLLRRLPLAVLQTAWAWAQATSASVEAMGQGMIHTMADGRNVMVTQCWEVSRRGGCKGLLPCSCSSVLFK